MVIEPEPEPKPVKPYHDPKPSYTPEDIAKITSDAISQYEEKRLSRKAIKQKAKAEKEEEARIKLQEKMKLEEQELKQQRRNAQLQADVRRALNPQTYENAGIWKDLVR